MRNLPTSTELNQAIQDMRRKVIALLMSWKPDQFGYWNTQLMRHVPNMSKIYDWINTYGHLKPKWLNKYTYEELTVLVSQIEKITTIAPHGKPKKDPKPKRRDQTDIRSPAKGGAQGDGLLPGAD